MITSVESYLTIKACVEKLRWSYSYILEFIKSDEQREVTTRILERIHEFEREIDDFEKNLAVFQRFQVASPMRKFGQCPHCGSESTFASQVQIDAKTTDRGEQLMEQQMSCCSCKKNFVSVYLFVGCNK